LARLLGMDPGTAGQAVSCLIGVVYAIAVARLASRLFDSLRSRLVALAVLLTPGYVQLFAGYPENYGLQVALYALWCDAIAAESRDPRPPLASPLWAALALMVHRGALLILPAQLGWCWWRRPAGGHRHADPRTVAGALAIAAALGVLVVAWLPQLREDVGFLLGTGPADPRNVRLFSLRHLADVGNCLFLLGPLTIVGALLVPYVLRTYSAARAWIGAGLPFVLIALLVRSNFHGLGAIRDWDAFAPAGFFLCVVAAAGLGAVAAARPGHTALAAACVIVGAFSSGAWLAVNASSDRALARAERIAYGAPPMQKAPNALALDALATIHERQGDHLAAARDRVRAAELFENARYFWAAGLSYWRAGFPDSARALFARAARNREFRTDLIGRAGGLGPTPRDPLLAALWTALRDAQAAAGEAVSEPADRRPPQTAR
jgi:hypothetical protein